MIQTERVPGRNLNSPLWPLNYRTGMWAYLLHRITGLALIFYLLMHIMVISSAMVGGKSAFDALLGLLQEPLFVVLDLGLIAAILFHMLNGIRLVLFDLGYGIRSQKLLFWGVIVVSVVGFILAVIASIPHIFH